VRLEPASFLVHFVLVFQLVVGVYSPAPASADIPRVHQPTHAAVPGHCADHFDHRAGRLAGHRAESGPAGHDCCRSSDCQCHCAYAPMLEHPRDAGAALASAHRLPASAAHLVTQGVSELFRPPIA
jgi:hypothetical protein